MPFDPKYAPRDRAEIADILCGPGKLVDKASRQEGLDEDECVAISAPITLATDMLAPDAV